MRFAEAAGGFDLVFGGRRRFDGFNRGSGFSAGFGDFRRGRNFPGAGHARFCHYGTRPVTAATTATAPATVASGTALRGRV